MRGKDRVAHPSRTWRLHRINAGESSNKCGQGRSCLGGGKSGHHPGVSILKPLVGSGDPNLYSNLETFFTQNYPKFELLFCVHSEDDPALAIVEILIKTYPSIDCRIFKGGQDVGINPKINNMMPGYATAKYELILISDSGIRSLVNSSKLLILLTPVDVKDDTLSDMVNHMTDKVGMITQLPFVCDRATTFANTLEKVFFGGYHARMYLAADSAAVLCSTGMSSMIRKQVLDECGGLQNYGKYIAEDYFMAESVVKKGWKCAISSQPAWQNHGCATVKSFHLRVARWAKLRIAMLPHMILLEPIQDCVFNGLLASWAVNYLFQWNSLIFFLIHMLIWMLLDYVLLCIVQNGPLPFGRFEFAVSWLYRELSAFPTFLYALLRPEIQWRSSGTYTLEWGGLAVKVRDGAGNGAGTADPPPPPALNPTMTTSLTSTGKHELAQLGTDGAGVKKGRLPSVSARPPPLPPTYSTAHQHSSNNTAQQNPIICSNPTMNSLSLNLNNNRGTGGGGRGGPLLLLSSSSSFSPSSSTTTKDNSSTASSTNVGKKSPTVSGTTTAVAPSTKATEIVYSHAAPNELIGKGVSHPSFSHGSQQNFGYPHFVVDEGHNGQYYRPAAGNQRKAGNRQTSIQTNSFSTSILTSS